jgi:predicted TIM-barrel fold metal-dependent hydrolase
MNHEIIDVHIHFGAPDDGHSGCYWSEEFTETVAYYAMLLLTKSLFKKVNIQRVKKHLLKAINGSKYVHKSVLLAMDQVYDESGTAHRDWTHLYVPNDYIAAMAKENERVLFGASVHPYRINWREKLDYCLENKAVLCKWIPSSQMIDPTNRKCIPFYKKLAHHQLPLLCHAGPEHVIPTSNKAYDKFNNPKYLRTALDLGVTVIIAHCAMPYFGLLEVEYQDDLEECVKLFEEAEQHNWRLYADLSAICTPFKIPYVETILKNLNKIPHEKLLFASDYPVPLFELSYNRSTNFFSWLRFVLKVAFMKNPLDKNYLVIKEMGFKETIFTNAQELFSLIQYSGI